MMDSVDTASDADPRPPLEVVAAVIVRAGRVLACRRAPGRTRRANGSFPAAKSRRARARRSALVREIREELGVGIRVGELLDRSVTTPARARSR